jgi:hypothetical protein
VHRMVPTRKSLAAESLLKSTVYPCGNGQRDAFGMKRLAYFVTSCVYPLEKCNGPPPNVTRATLIDISV